MTEPPSNAQVRVIGRYALYSEIASGGMATVHLARLLGIGGFARTVAVKRLHPQFAKDPEFVTAFLDEARVAARVQHPNVVPTLDVVATEGELFLVMEWIQGEPLSHLRRLAELEIPVPIACGVLVGALHGLHAAHEAKNERAEPLELVHRDISPQNILIGIDGIPRVADFGIAKAAGRVQTTREGKIKGKLRYMAPEQLLAQQLDRRADVFAASIVLWETLARQRLFRGDDAGSMLYSVLNQEIEPPSVHNPEVPAALDVIVMRGLCRERNGRWSTALEMAVELERAVQVPTAHSIGAWVQAIAGDSLSQRAERVRKIESDESSSDPAARSSIPLVAHDSGVSEAAMPAISAARPAEKRSASLFAATAIGAALTAGVIAWAGTRSQRPAPEPRVAAIASSAPAVASVAKAPTAKPSTPSPSVSVPPRSVSRVKARPATNCNPPYALVSSGGKTIKRWKPGCN